MAKIANVALTNTFDTWRTRSNQTFDRLSQFAINNSSLYANTITANNVLKATGNTVLGAAGKRTIVTGLLSANGRVTVGTNLAVTGNTTLSGLIANGALGTSNYVLRTNGTSVYWAPAGSTTKYLEVANAVSTFQTKAIERAALANTNAFIATKASTSNPTTSGLLAHTGRATISTNLAVTGNTTLSGTVNKVTITAPATGSTLTIADGKTLTTSNSLTLAGTDSTTMTFPATSTTVAGLSIAETFTAQQRGAISVLTDGATITPDFALANHYSVTLGGNRTLANPTNLTAGATGSIFISQDSTGSRTLSWGSYWDFASGTAPTLTTTASAVDRVDYVVRTTGSIHAVATLNFS